MTRKFNLYFDLNISLQKKRKEELQKHSWNHKKEIDDKNLLNFYYWIWIHCHVFLLVLCYEIKRIVEEEEEGVNVHKKKRNLQFLSF